MSGVRTPTRQFQFMCTDWCGDNLDSINTTASSIVRYVSQRAGIGINTQVVSVRLVLKSRNGEAFHTGCIPFYKYFKQQ